MKKMTSVSTPKSFVYSDCLDKNHTSSFQSNGFGWTAVQSVIIQKVGISAEVPD